MKTKRNKSLEKDILKKAGIKKANDNDWFQVIVISPKEEPKAKITFTGWQDAQGFLMGVGFDKSKLSKNELETLEKQANKLCEIESKKRQKEGKLSIWA